MLSNEQDSRSIEGRPLANALLLMWPWPWPDDLEIRAWAEDFEDVPACIPKGTY